MIIKIITKNEELTLKSTNDSLWKDTTLEIEISPRKKSKKTKIETPQIETTRSTVGGDSLAYSEIARRRREYLKEVKAMEGNKIGPSEKIQRRQRFLKAREEIGVEKP